MAAADLPALPPSSRRALADWYPLCAGVLAGLCSASADDIFSVAVWASASSATSSAAKRFWSVSTRHGANDRGAAGSCLAAMQTKGHRVVSGRGAMRRAHERSAGAALAACAIRLDDMTR